MIDGQNLVVGIIAGIISTVACTFIFWLLNYCSYEAKSARMRLKACRKAICELINRFELEIGKSAIFEHSPTLTIDNYRLCLFEAYLVLNNDTGRHRYPDDDEYKKVANTWYNEWKNNRMADAIEFLSPFDMNTLLIEIDSWGETGRPWMYNHLPCIMKLCNRFRQWRYCKRSKSEKICDFLYRKHKLPPRSNTTRVMLDIMSNDDE